ncbi:MAG TPA: 2-phosphosulfolactate phosphatase [Castellaniella sp.]|jgi:2-phosphosulfolactate phosphatase|nr:2-phosphosulfolactate phosphatase [Castellaniella sp.]
MPNIYVVPTKDALRTDRRAEASAIVLDIIFATSSMVAALESGVSRVLPALDLTEAEQLATGYTPGTWILAGEKHAESFPGYHSYEPLALIGPEMDGKTLVYATTNGTVALRRAHFFSDVYIANLRNGPAVVRHLLARRRASADIVILCSGSRGHFSLEDFYGAGYIVHCLRQMAGDAFRYSDAAIAAELAFEGTDPQAVLMASRVGRMMCDRGLAQSIRYVSQLDACGLVAMYQDGAVAAA